jgi:hypothetical protein
MLLDHARKYIWNLAGQTCESYERNVGNKVTDKQFRFFSQYFQHYFVVKVLWTSEGRRDRLRKERDRVMKVKFVPQRNESPRIHFVSNSHLSVVAATNHNHIAQMKAMPDHPASYITVQVTVVIHGGRVPANRRVYKKRVKWETYNNRHFDVKLAPPEFFDAKLIICITFPDTPGEGSTQVIGFKISPWIGY